MNSKPRLPFVPRALALAFASSVLFSTGNAATLVSATAALPAYGTASYTEGVYSGPNGTGTITGQTQLATFDFASTISTLPSLGVISITMTLINFDTEFGSTDFNNITLVLNGIDTGVKLNGFTNSFPGDDVPDDTRTITATTAVGAAILDSMNFSNGTNGLLTASLNDSTIAPKNKFFFAGGTASISLSVPFSPTQSLGLAVLGLIAGSKLLRRRSWGKAATLGFA